MPSSTVPDQVKRNIRAVLLSKVGGVLVSDLVKDYKSLLKESLRFKDLGFSNIKEFVEAIPDVCRLEYDEGIMAHKLYGIGDKSTYMSLSQKRAEKSKSCDSSRKTGPRTAPRGQPLNPDLLPNNKGLYTLCYPRSKEPKTFSEQDLEEKFSRFGHLAETNVIPGLFFLRFSNIDSAQAALDSYSQELEIRPAAEKTRNRNHTNSREKTNAQNEMIVSRNGCESSSAGIRSSSSSTDDIEVFVGNIPFECDLSAFKEEISSFGSFDVQIKSVKGNDKKIFAFVKFHGSEKSQAEALIEKYNENMYKGRKLNVRFSTKDPPPKNSWKKSGSRDTTGNPKSHDGKLEKVEPSFDEPEEKWDETEGDNTASTSVWGGISREPITSPEPPQATSIISEQLTSENTPITAMEELHINTDFHTYTNFQVTKETTSPVLSVHSQRSTGSRSSGLDPHPQAHKSVLKGTNPQPAPKAPMYPGRYPRPLEDYDEMPSLEPSGPPPLQRIQQDPHLFISNFPYGESDEELLDYFSQYGAYGIIMKNRNDPKLSTRAMVYVANIGEAERAVLECNQMLYKGRRLLVNISKYLGDNTVNFLSSYHEMDNIKCTVTATDGRTAKVDRLSDVGPGGDVNRKLQQYSNEATTQGETYTRSWNSLMQTYKIVMSTLRLKPFKMRPQTKDIIIYITSVFDQHHFWGQIVVDETSLNALTDTICRLQEEEHRIGPTKGLGRCAALYKEEWFRAWVIGEKANHQQVDVFFVDYGNISTVDRRKTSLTTPYIWETKPILQPFVISVT
ncbi:uncharacterized protein LOC125649880 isoform X2 [Ostrea edulis]|uniref:uncharacterized protein LOC125649880 isoform X2 n=1 Tax=Ostrea edulis TaxID=37623 RepID=UPI0024AFF5B3|nr:uncharacterized protein LOC125649880 isoform X2 [Ostrea edulis]